MSALAGEATEVIWHQAECGGYADDFALWEQLSADAGGAVLDAGCGAGRVALHLARRGYRVHGVDREPALIAELRRQATAERLGIAVTTADVRELAIPGEPFALAIASMQLLQMLAGPGERAMTLERLRAHLRPGGVAAIAIVEGTERVVGDAGPDVVPDVREAGGWVYSSLPIEVVARDGHLEVLRLRQTVAPEGGLSEIRHIDRLAILDAETVEHEGALAGLVPAGRRPVDQSEMHVGSTVVLLRREA